jgi:eukaryotic-like serine/threonine-protein kinase
VGAVTEILERLKAALADRYTLQRELGRGGMATVYLAEDLKHHRPVALKVLRPELAAVLGPDRFLREIELSARLTHPHILPLHDSGNAAGFLYYVMPYVEGESLRDRLNREKQLPLDDALQIAREVADALSYAHSHDVIHRDIKPENILLESGHAVVADFGIARAITTAGGDRLTETGLVLGTPAYMSPEQSVGEQAIDGRSDLYALGCVLYEMLAGEPPHTGATAQAVIAKRLSGVVPRVSAVRASVTPGLERVLDRMLANVAADRFATASQVVAALTAEPAPATRSPSPEGPRLPQRRMLVAAATAALVVVTVTALWVRRSPGPRPDRNRIAVAPFDILEPSLELWREGLVDVLSAGLDGAGPLQAVAPTIVIRRWSGRVDAASAALLAERTGAELVVFGRLVGTGADSVRATAAILDAPTGKTVGEVEVRELSARIDRLADTLTVALLRELGRTRPIGAARLASLRSSSLPALKAFLQGEQYFRRTVWDSALASYQHAVDLDSTFTVALRRVSHVLGWQGTAADSLSRVYLLRAGRLNRGLSPRDSLLVVADSLWAALFEREADAVWWAQITRMTAVLGEVAQRYPQDPEVWWQLGEAGFHWGQWVGVTQRELLEAFERAIALDSAFAPAYLHLVPLALELEGPAAARRHAAAYLALHPSDDEAIAIGIAYQLLDSLRPWTPEIARQLDTVSAPVLFEAWAAINTGRDSAEPEMRLARLFAAGRPGAPPSLADPGFRTEILSGALARRGHLHEAYHVAGAARPELIADLAMVGGLPTDTLRAIFHRGLEARGQTAPWALAWWAGQGDTLSIMESLRQTEAVRRDPQAAQPRRDRAEFWSRAAYGYLALARRDTVAALRTFLALPDSLCGTCYAPRLTTARLLVDQGRYAEATQFLRREITGEVGGSTIAEVLWELERARTAERAGDRSAAIEAYQHVAAVWQNGDPALRSILDSASAALERLGSSRSASARRSR